MPKSMKIFNPETLQKGKQTNVSKIPPPIPPRPSKKFLEKSKFFKKNQTYSMNSQSKRSNVNEIIKIKDAFPNLSSNKVSEIHKVINNSFQKVNPKINMIIKGPLRKHIIVPMRSNNTERVMVKVNAHISNINRLLKRVKSGISVDFICSDNKRLLITTIKVAAISNLNIIEKYIKELNDIDLNDIMNPRLSQSKSYLKILGIPYFIEDTNLIESVIKSNHIFNDIVLALHPCIIKAFPKSDIVVI